MRNNEGRTQIPPELLEQFMKQQEEKFKKERKFADEKKKRVRKVKKNAGFLRNTTVFVEKQRPEDEKIVNGSPLWDLRRRSAVQTTANPGRFLKKGEGKLFSSRAKKKGAAVFVPC